MTIEHKKPRNNDRAKKFTPRPGVATAPAGPFKESLGDQLGADMLNKLRKHLEDQQKRKIRDAMNDPKVKKASEAFAKKA